MRAHGELRRLVIQEPHMGEGEFAAVAQALDFDSDRGDLLFRVSGCNVFCQDCPDPSG